MNVLFPRNASSAIRWSIAALVAGVSRTFSYRRAWAHARFATRVASARAWATRVGRPRGLSHARNENVYQGVKSLRIETVDRQLERRHYVYVLPVVSRPVSPPLHPPPTSGPPLRNTPRWDGKFSVRRPRVSFALAATRSRSPSLEPRLRR